MHGPYYRVGDSPEVVRKILESGELWGSAPRNIFQSDFPKVKAFAGHLPSGESGFEFETEVAPDDGCHPDKPTWSGIPNRAGVWTDGAYARINVRVVRQTVI